MYALIRALMLVLGCAVALPASAQRYPAKPVRMIVGIAPGGGLDSSARLVASKLSEVLGQQVVVDNRPGAGGTIAAAAVAAAAPDGYTLQYAATSLLIAPSLYKNLSFDPVKSFTAVGGVGWEPLVVVVNPAVQARTPAELIALLKANPGKYSYGSPGVGSVHHLAMELFRTQAGVNIVHVPYKGAALYIPDLVSGVLPVAIASVTATLPQAKAGKLRAIALTRPIKGSLAPGWPALADTLPGFDAAASFFVVAPAGTPAEAVSRLSDALKTAVSAEDLQRSFAAQGATAEFMAPDVLAATIESEVKKWSVAARESGARLE
jgi:tripartite-type tricarboxylate transporter receptor subunit TctC